MKSAKIQKSKNIEFSIYFRTKQDAQGIQIVLFESISCRYLSAEK